MSLLQIFQKDFRSDQLSVFKSNIWMSALHFKNSYLNALVQFLTNDKVDKDKYRFETDHKIQLLDKIAFIARFKPREQIYEFLNQ